MRQPNRKDCESYEEYEDLMEQWYDYCDYKYDEMKDDALIENYDTVQDMENGEVPL